MFDLAADFRNVPERNPRIGQLPVSSVTYVEPPLKYHPCGHGCLTALRYPGPGRSFLMSSTASWKPHGRPLGTSPVKEDVTPESEVAPAGTYELQAIGCASGTRLLNSDLLT